MYEEYVSCTTAGRKPVALTAFQTLWRQPLPFVAVMRPSTDLCWVCQQGASRLSRKNPKSSSMEDCKEETAATLSAYSEHLAKACQERSVYKAICESSKHTMSVGEKLGHHNMCSRNKTMHFSFAQ